ncbi:MAG: hypothetical protein KIT70_03320 [Anaerolineales bacterium]|nr:MAG: hypothetical protein KIT70_03320 [Anaerolineales bacterium]
MTKQKRILADHQRQGSKFIAPMRKIEKLEPISWGSDLLPEFLWIGLIIAKLGFLPGVRFLERLIGALKTLSGFDNMKLNFAFASSFYSLSIDEKINMLVQFGEMDKQQLEICLAPILVHYPANPFDFIADAPEAIVSVNLEEFKVILSQLTNRREALAMQVQTTALYISMLCGRLVVNQGSSLENIEHIKDYPDTEESRKVGSMVRAFINASSSIFEINSDWSKRFWNRSLEIEGCYGFE